MALTEFAVRNAKPKEKSYSLSDGDGLLLLVNASGGKSWVLRYRMDRKERRAGLGKYPAVTLAKARELKIAFKREIALGGNPRERKRAERGETARANILRAATFAKIADEWYAQRKETWSDGYRGHMRQTLDSHLCPKFGERSILEITTRELLDLLLDIEERAPSAARRAREVAGQIFRFAVTRGDADFNIVSNLKGALKQGGDRHRAALTAPRDVADLMTRIDAYHGSAVVRTALWFSLYTFQRPGEISGAAWKEMDIEAKLWRKPESRMKNRRPHVVPMSRQVMELLEFLKRIAVVTGHSPFIFPSKGSKTAPMNERAVCSALRIMGYTSEQMTAHGFRAIASTNLNEQGWNRDVIELSLAHSERNRVRAAYNHAERLSERRDMMQAWADWLDGLHRKI
jgi:integrase